MNILFIVLAFLGLSHCASLSDAGRAYFRSSHKLVGVEEPQKLLDRFEKNSNIQKILYASKKDILLQCSILRQQVYVASRIPLGSEDKAELKRVVDILEQAYQQDDALFLQACEEVLTMRVGRVFSNIQAFYIRDIK
jgi:hypothetical protein